MIVQRTSAKYEESKGHKAHTDSASSSQTGNKSNPVKTFFLWITQCCRAPQRRNAGKRTKNFWKRAKDRVKRCSRKKKSSDIADQSSTATTKESTPIHSYPASSETADRKHGKTKRSQQVRKKVTSDTSISSPIRLPDEKEEVIKDHVLEKGFPDFTKSCCYMCTNAMTIAGMISNKIDKSHVSIQTSSFVKEKLDKGCSPVSYVRTVQSSVKVKIRNVGTNFPDDKKTKKTKAKPKLKLKHLKQTILPKLPKIPSLPKMPKMPKLPQAPKFSKQPRIRTVACATDTSTKYTNTPQCMARRGTQCVRETN